MSYKSREHGATLNVATKTNWDASIPEYWDKAVMYESDRQAVTSKLSLELADKALIVVASGA